MHPIVNESCAAISLHEASSSGDVSLETRCRRQRSLSPIPISAVDLAGHPDPALWDHHHVTSTVTEATHCQLRIGRGFEPGFRTACSRFSSRDQGRNRATETPIEGLKAAALIAGLNLFDLPELTVPVKHHFRLFVICNPDAHRLKSSRRMIAPGHELCLGHTRSNRHWPYVGRFITR